MAKKRVALIDYDMSVTGGAEAVAASLAEALTDEFDVFVISILEENGNLAYDFSDRVNYVSLGCHGGRLREIMAEAKRPLRRVLSENGIDVALLIGNYSAFVSIPAMLFSHTKFVYCDHGALINQIRERQITVIRFLNSMFAKRLVVLTDKTHDDYIKIFHLRKKKVLTIPNWVNENVLENAVDYDPNSQNIMSVGRFGPEKGYDMLVEVAKKVLPDHPQTQWHLFGDGETFDDIKSRIHENGLENQLILMGNCRDVLLRYRNYSMLVLPSYREGLPLVLLEAKANNLPIVSFDIDTGPREMVDDGVNGYLIKPYDIDEMAMRINELLCDRELRIKFSNEAKRNINKFEKKTILKKWCDFINSL